MLEMYLQNDYAVYFISFEGLGEHSFRNTQGLVRAFFEALEFAGMAEYTKNITSEMRTLIAEYLSELKQVDDFSMQSFSRTITRLCHVSAKPVVLMIDEVDQASGYQSFIDFLGILRAKFLDREKYATFHSVILASVYNIIPAHANNCRKNGVSGHIRAITLAVNYVSEYSSQNAP